MKSIKIVSVFAFLITLFTFTSCEKVIELDLNDAETQIVIEAVISDFNNENYVKLSKSANLSDSTNGVKITDANVYVTDQNGVNFQFTHQGNGYYTNNDILTSEQQTYFLTIEYGDETYTSEVTTTSKNNIDYMYTFGYEDLSTDVPNDSSYLLFFSFLDDASEENYYRVRLTVNGVKSESLYLGDDALANGSSISAPLFADFLSKGDTALLELISLDAASYEYYYTISNTEGGAFAPTPANPVSNIEGGAIGYFAPLLVDTMTFVVQ